MLTACIVNMNRPINNTKKLLDIYAGVLSINKSKKLAAGLVNKLNSW